MNALDAVFCSVEEAGKYLVQVSDDAPDFDPAVVDVLVSRKDVRQKYLQADKAAWAFKEANYPIVKAAMRKAGFRTRWARDTTGSWHTWRWTVKITPVAEK
jgi:hypothetical protein